MKVNFEKYKINMPEYKMLIDIERPSLSSKDNFISSDVKYGEKYGTIPIRNNNSVYVYDDGKVVEKEIKK